MFKFCVVAATLPTGITRCHTIKKSGAHLSWARLTGKRVPDNKKTEVKDHLFAESRPWVGFMIFWSGYKTNGFKMLIKESLLV